MGTGLDLKSTLVIFIGLFAVEVGGNAVSPTLFEIIGRETVALIAGGIVILVLIIKHKIG